jgi:hypothetical protein
MPPAPICRTASNGEQLRLGADNMVDIDDPLAAGGVAAAPCGSRSGSGADRGRRGVGDRIASLIQQRCSCEPFISLARPSLLPMLLDGEIALSDGCSSAY